MPNKMRDVLVKLYHKIRPPLSIHPDPLWIAMQKKLAESKRVVDLGCGNDPIKEASVCVDRYIEPKERSFGAGPTIDLKKMQERGVTFVNAKIDAPLPFKDKEFDFAYSHHVFEHVDDPLTACKEMMRIAHAGVIITPSLFADIIFGRPYHQWLIVDRKNQLFFFKKRPHEDRPFGEHPVWNESKKTWEISGRTNPFDIILNEGGWHHKRDTFPQLTALIRKYWYSHSQIMNVIFLWENKFECTVISD